MLRARVGIAILLAAVVCGCTSSNSTRVDSAPGGSAGAGKVDASNGGLTDASGAGRALRNAVRQIVADGSVRFRSVTSVAGHDIFITTGLGGADGWEATTIARDPSRGPVELRARSTNGSVWMTMPGWPVSSRGCWLVMSATDVPVGILAMTPDQPAYITILRYLRATGYAEAGNEIKGTLGLQPAFYLLSGQLAQHLHLTGAQAADGMTAVQIRLHAGRVGTVTLSGDVLAGAIEKAGGTIDTAVGDVLNHLRVTLTYSPAPHDVHVRAPASDQVMTTNDTGCPASTH